MTNAEEEEDIAVEVDEDEDDVEDMEEGIVWSLLLWNLTFAFPIFVKAWIEDGTMLVTATGAIDWNAVGTGICRVGLCNWIRHNGLNKFEGVIDFLISNCCEIWVVAEDEDVDDIEDAEVEDMIGRNEERVSTRNDAELILHLIKAGLFCLEALFENVLFKLFVGALIGLEVTFLSWKISSDGTNGASMCLISWSMCL